MNELKKLQKEAKKQEIFNDSMNHPLPLSQFRMTSTHWQK